MKTHTVAEVCQVEALSEGIDHNWAIWIRAHAFYRIHTICICAPGRGISRALSTVHAKGTAGLVAAGARAVAYAVFVIQIAKGRVLLFARRARESAGLDAIVVCSLRLKQASGFRGTTIGSAWRNAALTLDGGRSDREQQTVGQKCREGAIDNHASVLIRNALFGLTFGRERYHSGLEFGLSVGILPCCISLIQVSSLSRTGRVQNALQAMRN